MRPCEDTDPTLDQKSVSPRLSVGRDQRDKDGCSFSVVWEEMRLKRLRIRRRSRRRRRRKGVEGGLICSNGQPAKVSVSNYERGGAILGKCYLFRALMLTRFLTKFSYV